MIGIIGYGRFAKLMTKYLAQDFPLKIFSSHEEQNQNNVTFTSLREVCEQKIIIPAVPISAFEETIKQIAPLIKKDSIIIDVCSVKEYPLKIMLDNLDKEIQILATPPMFGPDSARDLLVGRKMILCKGRISQEHYQKIKSYLEGKKLSLVETTAEEHDKEAATSLFLTHFIGRSLEKFQAKELEIDTAGYNRLLHVLETVTNDSLELFKDMHKYNRFAQPTIDKFKEAVKKIEGEL